MTAQEKSGLLVAAPASGSGKTVFTLALLRALGNAGYPISGAKAGPDYIDPAFHGLASGVAAVNLDPWAMSADRIRNLASRQPGSHLLIEGMMGLFDGAADGSGSAANLAKVLGLPVLLIVDAAKQSQSIAALVRGFRDHDPDVVLCGLILNRVGSERHRLMLCRALEPLGIPVLGCLPRSDTLSLPERHLGLVQASEHDEMHEFVHSAAKIIEQNCDLEGIENRFAPLDFQGAIASGFPPLGQHIAIACDAAFSFSYPHMLDDWRHSGAEISFFSPLEDEMPAGSADAVFLPGGYPELYGARLASAAQFKSGLEQCAGRGALVYGECGGYMVLGDGLVDKEGTAHAMAGLLRLETSFEKPMLHLGYRKVLSRDFVLGERLMGHEFHYTSPLSEHGDALFHVEDAMGKDLGPAGLRCGNVMGSYLHIIDGAGT